MATFTCKESGCDFKSYGHDTKKQADARGEEHAKEHETGKPMREIKDFMKAQTREAN